MKKLIKRTLSVGLILGIIAGNCIGCGKAGESNSNNDTIKLGLITDTSGTSANTQTLNSVSLAVDEINEAGGLLGKKIEIHNVDSQSDTQRYQEMGKKLILEDKVDVLFTGGTSACREALRPVAEKNKKLYFYCNSYEGGVASRYMFMAGPVPEQTVDPLLQYTSENVGKKIYCLVADYNYGRVMVKWLKEKSEKYGVEIVGEEYVPLTVSQFSTNISKIQQSGADAVFIATVGSNQASFFDQWANAGIKDKTLMSLSNFCSYYEHKKLAAPSLAGSLTAAAYMEEFDTEASKKFVEKYRAKYPDEPYITSNCSIAYNAVYVWAESVKKANSIDTEDVIKAIETQDIEVEGPGGKIKVEGKTHHLYTDISLVKIDENHNAKVIKTYENEAPTYLLDKGIDLSKEDPKKQYTPLDEEE